MLERTTTSPAYEDWPTLTGRQEPHFLLKQDGDHSHGEKALVLAERTGTRAMPWQRAATLELLAQRPGGLWTHPDAVIICPRQNGKSLILSIRILYGIFVLGENVAYTAQRWQTAEDIYKRTWAMIEKRPSLLKRVVRHTCSQGRGTIELQGGAQVVFTTRSADAGRGLTKIDLVIYDEAYSLTDGEMSALSPAQLAADDPQTIYASSAVNQALHPDGHVLTAMRARGYEGEPDMYLAEFMAPEEMDREDEATWRYANPSYGVIQNATKVRKLMRGFATPAGRKSFDVEILGRGDWPADVGEGELIPVIDPEFWATFVRPEPELDMTDFAVAFDMPDDRSVLTIVAATRRVDGGIHYEVILHARGRDEVETLVKVCGNGPRATCVSRSSPAMSLVPDLEAAGVEVTLVNEQQQAQANGALVDELGAGLVSHTGDPLFDEALRVGEKRDTGAGGAWVWDRKGAQVSPIVGVSLARFGMWAEAEEEPKQSAYEESDFIML